VGCRGNQNLTIAARAPVDSVRALVAASLAELTSRDVFYYMQDQALPHHPLFEQATSTSVTGIPAGRDAAAIQARTPARRCANAQPFCRAQQEIGITCLAVMGGRGHLNGRMPGACPTGSLAVDRQQPSHWAEARQQAPTSGLRCCTARDTGQPQPKEAKRLRCWACVDSPHPSSVTLGAAVTRPACARLDAAPGSALNRALAWMQAWRRQREGGGSLSCGRMPEPA